ncbi:MAG: hypothetical protein PHN75_11005, partial [Syntrophales bacterium]|nr:hypothetical protein [Syntrophales bacterium]
RGAEKIDLNLRYFQKFGMPPPGGLRNFSPNELKDLVKEAGFIVRLITVLGDNPKALYLRSTKPVKLSGKPHFY